MLAMILKLFGACALAYAMLKLFEIVMRIIEKWKNDIENKD